MTDIKKLAKDGYIDSISTASLTASTVSIAGGDIDVNTINGIPLRPGVLDPENRIINGAFDFWQRGTSSSVSAYGTADRWAHFFSGGSITVSRQDFIAADGPLGVTTPSFFLRYLVSGQTTGNFAMLQQRIEGGRSYAGQTITVLGWARRSSGSGNIACRLTQHFGTGGSPSADVSVSGQAITLGATFAPFALTFSVPNVSGKTFGTNVNDYLNLIFDISGGSAAINAVTVDLWGIHIKVGTHTADATSLYRQPERGSELARCRRYYEVVPVAFAMNTTNFLRLLVQYKVTKRGLPSATASRAVLVWNGSWVAPTTLGIFPFPDHVVVETSPITHTSVGNPTDNTALLAIDAEL